MQLYYLMSRYYDPQTGRFINADSLEYLDPETIGGLNLYAYCGNNPVMGVDPLGTSSSFWNYIKREFDNWWTNAVRQFREIPQDIQATVDALMNNFVFDLGLGVGIGLSTNGKVSVGAGAWMDFFHISISKEWENGVAVGMRGYVGGGITFFDLFEFGGTKVDEFRKYGSKEFINSPDNYSSFVGISYSSYFLIGGSISIGFNLGDLLYDLKEIWR